MMHGLSAAREAPMTTNEAFQGMAADLIARLRAQALPTTPDA